jgi:hypothetical protein
MSKPPSVMAFASVILFGSLVLLVGVIAEFVSAVEICHRTAHPVTTLMNVRVAFLGVFPGIIGILGFLAAFGLFRLRTWARRIALYLASVPVTVYAILAVLKPQSIFPPQPRGAISAVGDLGYAFCIYLVAFFAPLSLWALILLTRREIRSQFS